MKKILRDVKLATSVTSVLMIILGIMLLVRPGAALAGVCRFAGAILLIIGLSLVLIFSIRLRGEKGGSPAVLLCIVGAIIAAIGLYILIRPQAVLGFVGIWFAVLLLLHGLNGIREMLNLKKYRDPKWYYMLGTIVFNIVAACLILLHPFGTVRFVMQIAGVGLLISGIMGLGTNVRVIQVGHSYRKTQDSDGPQATIIDVEPEELRKIEDKKR